MASVGVAAVVGVDLGVRVVVAVIAAVAAAVSCGNLLTVSDIGIVISCLAMIVGGVGIVDAFFW